MTDVRLGFNNLKFDLVYNQGQIESDDGLETAVCISLFTDKRVKETELQGQDEDRRGWWADSLSEINGDQIGSKLWLLDRMSASPLARTKAEEYSKEALKWLVDDGIAESVKVTALLVNREHIELNIEITRPIIKNKFYYRFQFIWEGQLMNVRKVI